MTEFNWKKFNFVVTDCHDATHRLNAAHYAGKPIKWAISIIDPGAHNDVLVPEIKATSHHLVLRFEDTEQETVGMYGRSGDTFGDITIPPGPDHVDKILTFTEKLKTEGQDGDHVIVHCHAGISRSPASLFVIFCALAGPGKEEECLTQVYYIRPNCAPNCLVVDWGDTLLKRDRKLVRAYRARPGSGSWYSPPILEKK